MTATISPGRNDPGDPPDRRGGRRGAQVVVGLAVVYIGAVACGGASSTGGGAASSSGQKSPIKVMVEGAISGPVYALPEMVTGAKAAVTRVNSDGGVNGRQLQLVVCDDQGNPNNAAACGRTAVSDGVTALVGGLSVYDDNLLPPLQKANIPYIASYDISNTDHTSPASFPININAVDYAGFGTMLAKSGCTAAAGLAPNQGGENIIKQDLSYMAKAFTSNGGKTFKDIIFPLTATDLTADVATALTGGAQCVGLITGPQQTVQALTALQKSGQKIPAGTNLATVVPALFAPLKLAPGSLVVSGAYFAPGPGQKSTAVAQFVTDMNASHTGGAAGAVDTESENSYNAVLIFAQAAKGLSEVTGPNVLKSLNTLTTDTGLTPPVNFGSKPIFPDKPRDRVSTQVPYDWTGTALKQSGQPFQVGG